MDCLHSAVQQLPVIPYILAQQTLTSVWSCSAHPVDAADFPHTLVPPERVTTKVELSAGSGSLQQWQFCSSETITGAFWRLKSGEIKPVNEKHFAALLLALLQSWDISIPHFPLHAALSLAHQLWGWRGWWWCFPSPCASLITKIRVTQWLRHWLLWEDALWTQHPWHH